MKKVKVGTYLLVGAAWGGLLVFYIWFQGAHGDQPQFLLRPVVWLTSVLSGLPFTYVEGIGYLSAVAGMRYTVERSCSGGTFFVISLSLLLATQVPKVTGLKNKIISIIAASILAYVFAVLASSLRIVSTVVMMEAGLRLDHVTLHNLIGIITYFAFICLYYFAALRLPVFAGEKE